MPLLNQKNQIQNQRVIRAIGVKGFQNLIHKLISIKSNQKLTRLNKKVQIQIKNFYPNRDQTRY